MTDEHERLIYEALHSHGRQDMDLIDVRVESAQLCDYMAIFTVHYTLNSEQVMSLGKALAKRDYFMSAYFIEDIATDKGLKVFLYVNIDYKPPKCPHCGRLLETLKYKELTGWTFDKKTQSYEPNPDHSYTPETTCFQCDGDVGELFPHGPVHYVGKAEAI